MIALTLALGIGLVVAVAYVTLGYQELQRARRSYDDTPAAAADDVAIFEEQEGRFTWVALGGVIVSTGLLALISVWSPAWYLLPFLSIGSAAAVVVAFLRDRESA